jgi:quercetin dioxygenase-like cupin family protein
MSYDTVDYEAVEPVGDGLYFLRDALDCENLGVSVFECDPGWTGKEHDHAEDGQEEVYLLLEGSATVTVDGDEVSMSAGDALRVDPESTRQVRTNDEPARLVVVGAP